VSFSTASFILFLAMWPSLLAGVAQIDPSGRWNLDGGTLLASHSLLILLSCSIPAGGEGYVASLPIRVVEAGGESEGPFCVVNGSTSEARRDLGAVGEGARLSLRPADERTGPPRLDVEPFDPFEQTEPWRWACRGWVLAWNWVNSAACEGIFEGEIADIDRV